MVIACLLVKSDKLVFPKKMRNITTNCFKRRFSIYCCKSNITANCNYKLHYTGSTVEQSIQDAKLQGFFSGFSSFPPSSNNQHLQIPIHSEPVGNPGADLGKMLTDLLQNECRRRKLLGVTGACSPKIGRVRKLAEPPPPPSPPFPTSRRAPDFPFPFPSYVNLICDIISCFVNILSVASKPTHSFHTRMW